MTERLETICARLPRVRTFADVGCDHGYCAKYMLDSGKCSLAYITDISVKSLLKAERLLSEEIKAGRCIPICCNGLMGLPALPDCVLIAGIGGEETVKILSQNVLPPYFVLQPMKNSEKLRRYLIGRGCRITTDDTFEAGMFYDFIAGSSVAEPTTDYTPLEFKFGRDNLRKPPAAFYHKLTAEREKLRAAAACARTEFAKDDVARKLSEIEEAFDVIRENLSGD